MGITSVVLLLIELVLVRDGFACSVILDVTGLVMLLCTIVLSYVVLWIVPLFGITVFLNRCRIVIEHGLALRLSEKEGASETKAYCERAKNTDCGYCSQSFGANLVCPIFIQLPLQPPFVYGGPSLSFARASTEASNLSSILDTTP